MSHWMILGGGGFVASHFVDLLLKKKEQVSVTIRWNEDLHRIKKFEGKIKKIHANLLDLSSLVRAFADNKPDFISHLAAESFVNDSFINPIVTVETNTVGTVNVLEAIRLVKDYIHKDWDPVIHVCSSSEYYGKVNEDEIPITENHPPHPGNPYAVGKIGADAAADFYFKYYGLKVIRTRMFTHTGHNRTMESAEVNFAKQIARIELGLQEPIVYHGNLHSVRTWADVRDAVDAYYLMMRTCEPGEVYNIGGNTTRTIKDTLEYLISLSPMKDQIQTKVDPKLLRKIDVNLQIVDCSKFIGHTEWSPSIPFEETMSSILNYWRKEYARDHQG